MAFGTSDPQFDPQAYSGQRLQAVHQEVLGWHDGDTDQVASGSGRTVVGRDGSGWQTLATFRVRAQSRTLGSPPAGGALAAGLGDSSPGKRAVARRIPAPVARGCSYASAAQDVRCLRGVPAPHRAPAQPCSRGQAHPAADPARVRGPARERPFAAHRVPHARRPPSRPEAGPPLGPDDDESDRAGGASSAVAAGDDRALSISAEGPAREHSADPRSGWCSARPAFASGRRWA